MSGRILRKRKWVDTKAEKEVMTHKRSSVKSTRSEADDVRPSVKRGRGRSAKTVAKKQASLKGEARRLEDIVPWRKWGPYLSERQWGTVREDYSTDGNCWTHFPHDAATYRAYRWGEDGLFGFCDEGVNVCLSVGLWNGKDALLKERLFGLTGPQGNHGEDVKELYYYLEATPSHAYQKMLYKYPQAAFPYQRLIAENKLRPNTEPEYELLDTGVFEGERYWSVEAEYVKASPGALLCRYTVYNRGPEGATITLLPQAWYRNTWSWEDCSQEEKPQFQKQSALWVEGSHPEVGKLKLHYGASPGGQKPTLLFTNNETNTKRMCGEGSTPGSKDAFHRYVIEGFRDEISTSTSGSKVAALYQLEVAAGASAKVECLLVEDGADLDGIDLDFPHDDSKMEALVAKRREECAEFYLDLIPQSLKTNEKAIARQAYAGLLWSKQFFFYDVHKWLTGADDAKMKINQEWRHMVNKDIISMPDKWEFPWYATWDLAFHMVPFGHVDVEFAKHQLLLFLSDRYMHPNGQLPAYEFNFSDVNPPVHAWACLHIYQQTVARGTPDKTFLKKCFHRLLLNFNWWVNKKSVNGTHLYSGGFLGMDNISAVERSHPPEGAIIKQTDGTGWMAFYSLCMLRMSLELSLHDDVYGDMAVRFLNHFLAISEEINGENGLWDEEDHFYYDRLEHGEVAYTLRIRSLVGLLPLVATTVLSRDQLTSLSCGTELVHALTKAKEKGLVQQDKGKGLWLLSVPGIEQVRHLLRYMLDKNEFLSPYGIRGLSKTHTKPFTITIDGKKHSVHYCPGESDNDMFGGNSNWRGPVWICLNFLLIEAVQEYGKFFGKALKVEHPATSGDLHTFDEVANDVAQRIVKIFLPDSNGHRPVHGGEPRYANNPHWQDLILFSEYFHGETGRGCGASHQTGWTALVVCLLKQLAEAQ